MRKLIVTASALGAFAVVAACHNDCSGATSTCQYSPEDARWVCVDHGRCVG